MYNAIAAKTDNMTIPQRNPLQPPPSDGGSFEGFSPLQLGIVTVNESSSSLLQSPKDELKITVTVLFPEEVYV